MVLFALPYTPGPDSNQDARLWGQRSDPGHQAQAASDSGIESCMTSLLPNIVLEASNILLVGIMSTSLLLSSLASL